MDSSISTAVHGEQELKKVFVEQLLWLHGGQKPIHLLQWTIQCASWFFAVINVLIAVLWYNHLA